MRKFIPHCTEIVAPLTNLLKNGVSFIWQETQKQAFQRVIEILTEKPVLQIFREDLPVELYTDASAIGIAAVLMQPHGPVSYFFKKVTPTEARYTATELELLAVVKAVQFYRVYLLGRHFTLYTDHHALIWLDHFEESKSKHYRWSEILSRYQYTIFHRPQTQMRHVDAISRAFTEEEHSFLVLEPPNHYDLIREAHDLQGHPGIKASLSHLRHHAQWKGMNQDVRNYVKTCHNCQMYKITNTPRSGFLQPLPSPREPMEILATDAIVLGKSAAATTAKYVLVAIDHHSCYVWAKAIAKNTAIAARKFLHSIIDEVGKCPKALLTDNGTNYTSKCFETFLNEYQVKHLYTTSYHPECNGTN